MFRHVPNLLTGLRLVLALVFFCMLAYFQYEGRGDPWFLLTLRIVLGPLTALGLGYLIHRTLEIPQTMAATGLFYIAILAVMVGELLGRLILFRTALPL